MTDTLQTAPLPSRPMETATAANSTTLAQIQRRVTIVRGVSSLLMVLAVLVAVTGAAFFPWHLVAAGALAVGSLLVAFFGGLPDAELAALFEKASALVDSAGKALEARKVK